MSDLRTLTDAFDELARRGDAAEARLPVGLPRRSPATAPRRAVPITVAATVVAGLATTIALLSPGSEPGDEPGTGAAGPPTTQERSWTPESPDELTDRFRMVLGARGTFEVTDTGSPASIAGTITAAGNTGGFDLQIYLDPSGRDAWCSEPSTCTETTLPDGSHLAASTMGLDGGASTHVVVRKTPDDVLTVMDVSSQLSPKGQSQLTADAPPLTLDQVIAVVADERW